VDIKRTFRESVWVYVFAFLGSVFGYLVRIMYARNFSVAEYGLFYAVLTFILLFGPLRDFGFNSSQGFYVNKFLVSKKYAEAKGVYYVTLGIQILIAVLISLIIFLLKPYLVHYFFRDKLANSMIDILLLLFIIQPIILSITNAFGSYQKFLLFQIDDFLNIAFIFLFSLLFFNLKFTLLTAPLSYLFACILTIVIYLFLYKAKLKTLQVKAKFEGKATKDVFKYAIAISLGSVAGVMLPYTDIIILTWAKGVNSVGYYNVVLPSMQIILTMVTPALNILSPIAVNLYHSKKETQLLSLASMIYNNLLIFTLPIAAIFFIYSSQVIYFVYGAKYLAASSALKVYILFYIFIILRRINFVFIGSIGHPSYTSKVMWIGVVFNTTLNLFLIYFFDYLGAVIAAGLTYLLMTLLSYNFLRKKVTINIDYQQQFKTIIAVILFILCALLLEKFIVISIPKWGIVIEGLIVLFISGIVYTISLFTLRVITKEKLLYIKKILFENPLSKEIQQERQL